MCEFCENGKEIKTDTGHWHIAFWERYGMYYRHRECKNSCGIEIFYCPLCGRKLSEETEKPSVDEILAELKNKLTEDDYEKLNDSIKSFSDGINGLWEVLGKGIENGQSSCWN